MRPDSLLHALISDRRYIVLEFLLLCVALPTAIITFKLAHFMFYFLWGASLYCWLIFRAMDYDAFIDLWKWRRVRMAAIWPILGRWAAVSMLMLAFLYWYDPDRLFYLERHRPEIIPYLMVFYPVLSALPQEFIFCTFFFARYRVYFGSGWPMIFASALLFGYAHMLYINPVAPVLSFFGGLIFAWEYAKYRSLALVTIEHGLYGISLFLIGLGWYFYSGAVVVD